LIKIAEIVGARPQFIKAGVVSRALRTHSDVRDVLIHTGQHYDENMSQVFFDELDIPRPDYNLGIGSGPHGQQTGRMLEHLEALLCEEKPDWVIVFGDTNSTLAGALSASKLQIPVAHVEAGLRSFNRRMPEEINRVLVDHTSDLLFAPTHTAERNLVNEGIPSQRIHVVGDVMFDGALHYGAKAEAQSQILRRLHLSTSDYVLATVHRAENTDDADRLTAIWSGLQELSREIRVVLPLHPRTRKLLSQHSVLSTTDTRFTVCEPVGYLDMVMLEKNARLIVTDSGGVQKEAFFHKVPCVTLREETEWVELVELGWNRLIVPNNARTIANGCRQALGSQPGRISSPFGDGSSAQKMVRSLIGQYATV